MCAKAFVAPQTIQRRGRACAGSLTPPWFEIAGDTCADADINGSANTLNKSRVNTKPQILSLVVLLFYFFFSSSLYTEF